MLSLSQTTGYAILALSCLSEVKDRLVLAREIAACTGVPLPYLSKILHVLSRTSLIHGKRGYRGGFALARPANRISLLQVAEAVDGEWLPKCLLGLADCSPERSCPTHKFWMAERVRIKKELRRITLADVAAFTRRRGLAGIGCCASHEPPADTWIGGVTQDGAPRGPAKASRRKLPKKSRKHERARA